MLEESVIITNKIGLHARPAALLVKTAGSFACNVELVKNEKVYNAKSIISVMSAAIKEGERIIVRTSGEGEAEALAAVTGLIKSGLEENRSH